MSKSEDFVRKLHSNQNKTSDKFISYYLNIKENVKTNALPTTEELHNQYGKHVDEKMIDNFFYSLVFTELKNTGR